MGVHRRALLLFLRWDFHGLNTTQVCSYNWAVREVNVYMDLSPEHVLLQTPTESNVIFTYINSFLSPINGLLILCGNLVGSRANTISRWICSTSFLLFGII